MVEEKCFAMFCQNCQLFGCTPRLKEHGSKWDNLLVTFGTTIFKIDDYITVQTNTSDTRESWTNTWIACVCRMCSQ